MALSVRLTCAVLMATAGLAACGAPAGDSAYRQPSAAEPETALETTFAPAPVPTPADSLDAHMRAMDTASAEAARRMLPTHRYLLTRELARMSSEVWRTTVRAPAAWNAAVDSVRRDLERLSEAGMPDLDEVMPAHRDRVRRLVRMYHEITVPIHRWSAAGR